MYNKYQLEAASHGNSSQVLQNSALAAMVG